MIEVNFVKVHEDARLPEVNHDDLTTGDSGYDVFCVEDTVVRSRSSCVVPTGIKAAYITPGYWYRVEARSGLGFKHDLHPHPGIIDNQYRGDLGIKIYNDADQDYIFKKGDKVAQIVFYHLIQAKVSWSEKAKETQRGEKGFGSSDK